MGNGSYGAGYHNGYEKAMKDMNNKKGGCLGIVIFFVSLISMLYKII